MDTGLSKKTTAGRICLVLSLVFGVGLLSASESYNPFDPYADTEFGKSYSPEKFERVKVGMTINQVREIVGKPLFQFKDAATMDYHYTNDRYLKRRTDKKFALVGDLAWYRSGVTFNADSIVTNVNSGWSYD
ncbi:outer membrane protein assembly factor BamE domain-containing protein [Hymenobacter daeguensis]